jgi:hypothetical protein
VADTHPRVEEASKLVQAHEEERSLRQGASRVDEDKDNFGEGYANNAERELAGLPPIVRVTQNANPRDVFADARKDDENKAPSARSAFWANADDGRVVDDRRPTQEEVREAYRGYEQRPDIEERASILAREQAAPGQFSDANVQSGSVTDGKTGVGVGGVQDVNRSEEDKGAKKEAKSVKNPTAEK